MSNPATPLLQDSKPASASTPTPSLGWLARLRRHAVLATGVCVGMAAGSIAYGLASAAGKDADAGPCSHLLLEYKIEPKNERVNWADYTSAPDTFLLVRLQNEPERVYLTTLTQDDPGFPQPRAVRIPRKLLPGEKVYVYLMDDDQMTNSFWQKVAKSALKKGGAFYGKVTSQWSLGLLPGEEVVKFMDDAGDAAGEITFDADDCLGFAGFTLPEAGKDQRAPEAVACELLDPNGGKAGALSVLGQ